MRALAGCLQNTGEGALSPYHRNGGDLVFQIGTSYFGCRDEHGRFDLARLKDLVASAPVRAIEIKLSQGAKPGLGGMLPGGQGQPARSPRSAGIPAGPGLRLAEPAPGLRDVDSMLDFVELVADRDRAAGRHQVGGRQPRVLGPPGRADGGLRRRRPRRRLRQHRRRRGRHRRRAAGLRRLGGLPLPGRLRPGLHAVRPGRADRRRGLHRRRQARAARERRRRLRARRRRASRSAARRCSRIGCIQAQKCHTDHCPTGVATQNAAAARAASTRTSKSRAGRQLRRSPCAATCSRSPRRSASCHPGADRPRRRRRGRRRCAAPRRLRERLRLRAGLGRARPGAPRRDRADHGAERCRRARARRRPELEPADRATTSNCRRSRPRAGLTVLPCASRDVGQRGP